MKKGLPSFFTSLGLLSGCISIIFAVSLKDLTWAGYFIIIAAFFDFVDGLVARVLNQISEFGKQLDSLSDVISFGVAPSMILYQLMNSAPLPTIMLLNAFLVAIFSALRLAKFNLDPGQKKNFKGLAVPANALFIAALGFATETSIAIPASGIILTKGFLLTVIVFSCYLLVSNINMFSMKFSTYGFRENSLRYVFLILSAALLLIFKMPGFAPIIILYIILSLINNGFVKME